MEDRAIVPSKWAREAFSVSTKANTPKLLMPTGLQTIDKPSGQHKSPDPNHFD